MYEQPEGVLCGVLFWRALEVQEVQQAQVVQVVLEGREDLCRRTTDMSEEYTLRSDLKSGPLTLNYDIIGWLAPLSWCTRFSWLSFFTRVPFVTRRTCGTFYG